MLSNVEIQKAKEAKSKAWADFKIKYTNVDLSIKLMFILTNQVKAKAKLFLKTQMELKHLFLDQIENIRVIK